MASYLHKNDLQNSNKTMFELSYGKSRPNVLHNTIRFEEEKLILNKWFCPAIKLYVVNFKSNFQEAADILWLNSINFLTLSFSLLCGHTEMMEFYFSSVVAMLGLGQQKVFYWKDKNFSWEFQYYFCTFQSA